MSDPFANVIRKHHVTRDITSNFSDASKALELGQLVKDENFTLFESVQALEIMDPKMDSGYLAPGDTLEDQYDLSRNLLPEEVLGIMDQILCYEMAWHQGYPLSQTLFTSHYLVNLMAPGRPLNQMPVLPESNAKTSDLVHLVLRAYCISVIKSCDMAIELITSQLYFEEEDLATNTCNLNLLTDVPDDEVVDLLDQANAWLESIENEHMSATLATALGLRLHWRREFLAAFLPPSDEMSAIDHWNTMVELVPHFKETYTHGRAFPEAFSAKLRRKLASTVPPRPVIQLTFEEAHKDLVQLHKDVYKAFEVLRFEERDCKDRWDCLVSFLWIYSAREPQPSAFARAMLQSHLFVDGRLGDEKVVRTLMKEHLEVHGLVIGQPIPRDYWDVEVPSDPRFQFALKTDRYTNEGAPEFIKILRSLCQNRCRVRRCLINVLSDFRTLFHDARNYEMLEPPANKAQLGVENNALEINDKSKLEDVTQLMGRAITQVIFIIETTIMDWIMALSFEQDLYLPSELSRMYWYRQTIKGRSLNLEDPALIELMAKDGECGDEKLRRRARYYHEVVSDTNFCTALCSLYMLLQRLKIIKTPPVEFGETEAVLELRLRPLMPHSDKLNPIINLNIERYNKLEKGLTIDVLFQIMRDHLKTAQHVMTQMMKEDKKNGVKTLRLMNAWRSCLNGIIFADALLKAHKQYGAATRKHVTVQIPPPEKLMHKAWIVPVITVKE